GFLAGARPVIDQLLEGEAQDLLPARPPAPRARIAYLAIFILPAEAVERGLAGLAVAAGAAAGLAAGHRGAVVQAAVLLLPDLVVQEGKESGRPAHAADAIGRRAFRPRRRQEILGPGRDPGRGHSKGAGGGPLIGVLDPAADLGAAPAGGQEEPLTAAGE